MPMDLIDAVIAQLEASAAVTGAFGDTWNQVAQTGVAKFFADVAGEVAEPYAVLSEVGESYNYMTAIAGGRVNYTAPGQMRISIWAPDRYQARQLGLLVASTLNDAPLQWPGEDDTMLFRLAQSMFMGKGVGVACPIVFNRVFIFEYEYSGVM